MFDFENLRSWFKKKARFLTKFNIYVDESGDAGISRIRSAESPGASPYFVLAAVVCEPTAEVQVKNAMSDFRNEIQRTMWKHATELRHSEKVFLARKLGKLPVRYFAAISNKETLQDYAKRIDQDSHKFYNKCAVYLLEKICSYLAPHISDPSDLQVVFEEQNHDYDQLIRFVGKVRDNPRYTESKALVHLNPFSMSWKKKGSSEMLDVADFVAHAVFQCTNRSKSNYGIPEPRYFTELSTRFAGDENGNPLGIGIKCIHSLPSLRLDNEIEQIFKNTKVTLPSRLHVSRN